MEPGMKTIEPSTDLAEMKSEYLKTGYVIARNIFRPEALAVIAETMRSTLSKGYASGHTSLDDLILKREVENHDLVYKGSHSLGSSAATYQLLGASPILDLVASLSDFNIADLHMMPMYLLVQLPSDERFDYAWHQDGAYYRQWEELVTLWFPITHAANPQSGTISCINGSHRDGLRPAETYKRHGFFRQIEANIDETEIQQEHAFELEVGDCCIMHGHAIHRSIGNRSLVPRVSGIVRLVNMARQDAYDREMLYCVHKS
jgi:ectoine hydroxylase-related dioxygenase (phytanoyl-CoA dioxygenase family)